MFLILFNLSGFMVLAVLFGMYMGCGNGIIDPLAIKSWEEFLMLRELMAKWNTYAYFLGWTMFAVIVLMLVIDALWIVYRKK